MGCNFLLQGIFPTQGSNPCLLHWQAGSLPLSHQRSPPKNYLMQHASPSGKTLSSVQFISVAQSCPTLCSPMYTRLLCPSSTGETLVPPKEATEKYHRTTFLINIDANTSKQILANKIEQYVKGYHYQFSSVAQSCSNLCDPMNCSTPGLPVQHQLPEFTQTHVH